MCDTIAVVADGAVWFAKNSDRDGNEAQLLEWVPRQEHPPGSEVRCTYVSVPQVPETHAMLLSRPFWIWGAEMGANEHGLVIGNEAVFAQEKVDRVGLLGMDLLRLTLERAASASEAVEVLTGLLEAHGQGGAGDHETRKLRYHNSYIIADPARAVVLETVDREWALEQVTGVRSISNLLTIPDFAEAHSDWLFTTVAGGRQRRLRTEAMADPTGTTASLMHALRDHGEGRVAPRYSWLNGTLGTVCMHGGGLVASSLTTASWISELRPQRIRHWVTGTAAPCTGLFKPVRVDQPLDLGPAPGDQADEESLWWRHEALHRRVMRNPERLMPLFAGERDAVETRWLAEPPEPVHAFSEGDRLLARWTARVAAEEAQDSRPWWARRYWSARNGRAGLKLNGGVRG